MELPTRSEIESNIGVTKSETAAIITFEGLSLTGENPTSGKIRVKVEKQPLQLVQGNTYLRNEIVFDKETENMQQLASQAEALTAISERERPRAVLELFRRNVRYAYDNIVEELQETNPELAKWIAGNTGLSCKTGITVKLSDIIDKGYGVCRHLATGYLWLAQKAGLEGTLMVSILGGITNIKRSDTGEQLFKSVPVGEGLAHHAWTEIRLADGSWVPVDPSVNLVGDNKESMAMFREADYRALANEGLELQASPVEKLDTLVGGKNIIFRPGDSTADGNFVLKLVSTRPSFSIIKRGGKYVTETLPSSNEPYTGPGEMRLAKAQWPLIYNLRILDVNVES